MTQSNTAIFILLITVFASSGVAQSLDAVEELKVCATMTDQDARFACLDNLGERVLREESADREPAPEKMAEPEAITATAREESADREPAPEKMAQPEAVTATATDVQPLPDDLGNPKNVQYGGLITSCKKGYYGNWFFVFDNGQVWKEVNNRNLRFKECNFNATITKDAFGYKMQIDGREKAIRVKRNR